MQATQQFFNLLFSDFYRKGIIEVREISNSGKVKKNLFYSLDKLFQYKPPLDKNVYFGLYLRGFKKNEKGIIDGSIKNSKFTNVIFLEYDKISLASIKHNLKKAKLPEPSMIVSSGNGFHLYWILRKPTYFDTSPLLKYLANKTGADIKATDKARLFRFPNSMNIKSDTPRKCEIISINDNKFDIAEFQFSEFQLAKKKFKSISNLKIKRKCVEEMFKGVQEGFRHFSLGRITKYLQQQGFKQKDVEQTVLDWNQKNKPALPEKEIINSFYKYWVTDYKLLGCKIPNIELQQKLTKFCNKPECQFRFFGAKLKYNKSIGLSNQIFNDYRKFSGYEIILYAILKRHSEGLKSSQIEEKITCKATGMQCMSKKTRRKYLNALKRKGYIEIIEKNRRVGKEYFYKFRKQGNYGLGFTILTNGSVNGGIDGRVSATELKIYLLLNKYCNDGRAFPSLSTLSKETGICRQVISIHIKALEKADYLKRYYAYNEKGAKSRIYELLV